jgi:hypothetical protein
VPALFAQVSDPDHCRYAAEASISSDAKRQTIGLLKK